MNLSSIPVPAVYREESADFRFFQKWFELALSKIQYDTEEFFDLFDPLRCPEDLLWMLGETMGYKYDTRMTPAFNRLAMVYFMSMIRLKGSKDGVTLSAQVNLDQFKLQDLAEENHILNNRLEDTSIPSNAIYVQPHVEEGYIDLVYFSDRLPTDVCVEYTRPVGMYLVPHVGVRYDAKDMLSVDARLTNSEDMNLSIGPTRVGHYDKEDYSRMQRVTMKNGKVSPDDDPRNLAWYRNSAYEGEPTINPGYRALYSLQLVNGEQTTETLLRGARSLGNITEENVTVFEEDGTVHDNSYYQEQAQERVVRDPTAYVPSEPMGTLGAAMDVLEVNQNSDDEEDS